jgi:hypothetical protein
LAIHIKGISLFDEKKRNKILEIEMNLIQSIKCFTNSLSLVGAMEKTYTFETT